MHYLLVLDLAFSRTRHKLQWTGAFHALWTEESIISWQHSGPYSVLLQASCFVNERILQSCATSHFSFVLYFLCSLKGRKMLGGLWPCQLHLTQGLGERLYKSWCKLTHLHKILASDGTYYQWVCDFWHVPSIKGSKWFTTRTEWNSAVCGIMT